MQTNLSETLGALLAHTESLYTAAAGERAKLHKHEFQQKVRWSALAEIELFSTEVAGAATAVMSQGYCATAALTTSLLDDPTFLGWFREHRTSYPLMCAYVVAHEYMRLLVEMTQQKVDPSA